MSHPLSQQQQFGISMGVVSNDLEGAQHVLVRQIIDNLECLQQISGILFAGLCERTNKYEVYTSNDQGDAINLLGHIDESCNSREKCMFCQLRSSEINSHVATKHTHADKACNCCQICCYNVIKVPIFNITEGEEQLGQVTAPCYLFGRSDFKICPYIEIDLLDKAQNQKYYITGTCLQSGNLARKNGCGLCRLQMCQHIHFSIKNSDHMEVGEITNIHYGAYNECCTKSDQFLVRFPPDADYHQRMKILYAVLMIDFIDFDSACLNLA